MAKRPIVEFLLQVINFIFTLCGLGVLFYGLYCLIKWKHAPAQHSKTNKIAHRLLLAIDPSKMLSDKLPTAWFIYLIIAIGAILFIISCFGYVGTASRSPCCLLNVMPADKSGNFPSVYLFLNENWRIIRWIALGVLILEVVALVFALNLRCVITRAKDDDNSGDESIFYCRSRRANVESRSNQTSSMPSTSAKNRLEKQEKIN